MHRVAWAKATQVPPGVTEEQEAWPREVASPSVGHGPHYGHIRVYSYQGRKTEATWGQFIMTRPLQMPVAGRSRLGVLWQGVCAGRPCCSRTLLVHSPFEIKLRRAFPNGEGTLDSTSSQALPTVLVVQYSQCDFSGPPQMRPAPDKAPQQTHRPTGRPGTPTHWVAVDPQTAVGDSRVVGQAAQPTEDITVPLSLQRGQNGLRGWFHRDQGLCTPPTLREHSPVLSRVARPFC